MSELHDHDLLEEEGAGYLISVSDIMAGLLFVFIITLTAFIINFQVAADRADDAEQDALTQAEKAEHERDRLQDKVDDLTNARRLRSEMLTDIRQALEARGIKVKIDEEHGILRLTENAILFKTGDAELPPTELRKLSLIGEVLMGIVPCYTANPPEKLDCQSRTQGKLDAVFIEGHTDNVPISGGYFRDNWDLSAQRAIFTYRYLISAYPGLALLINSDGQPIFSVSGYGEGRPVNFHGTTTSDAANRRIDLRFIMTPPRADAEIIKELRQGGAR